MSLVRVSNPGFSAESPRSAKIRAPRAFFVLLAGVWKSGTIPVCAGKLRSIGNIIGNTGDGIGGGADVCVIGMGVAVEHF